MRGILKAGALVLGALAAAFGIVGFFGAQIDVVQHKLETRSVVGRHYEALEDKDFRAAYNYFHPAIREDGKGKMGTFGDWKKDRERDQVEAINVYHLETANIQSGRLPEVIVEFQTRDKTGSPCFDGSWKLKKQGMYWKLYDWDTQPKGTCELTTIKKLRAWINETIWLRD